MTGLPLRPGTELRQTLGRAAADDQIVLQAWGEYHGPFILDKPMTVIGQGNVTTLYAQNRPAVVILSPGVRLEHLELVDSFDPYDGICLLVEQSARPILTQVNTHGRVETVSQEQVINFGEILVGRSASTFIELEIAEPATVECIENSADWLRIALISPDQADPTPERAIQLPSGGRYMLRLVCSGDTFLADDIALGQIQVVSQTVSHALWVYARIVPAYSAQPLTENLVLATDEKQYIRVNESFLIGRDTFPKAINGDTLPEQQAFILRDNNQAWAIFQPWANTSPTLVNGRAMGFGQRMRLSDGDIIEAGAIRLTVEAAGHSGRYAVDKIEKIAIDLGSTPQVATKPNQSPVIARRQTGLMPLSWQKSIVRFRESVFALEAFSYQQWKQRLAEISNWGRIVKLPNISDFAKHQPQALRSMRQHITISGSTARQFITQGFGQVSLDSFRLDSLRLKMPSRKVRREILHGKLFKILNHPYSLYATLALVIVLGIILAGSYWQDEQQQARTYQQFILTAQQKFTQAQTGDDHTVVTTIAEAERALNQARQIKADAPEVMALEQQITVLTDRLTKVKRLATLQALYHYGDAGTRVSDLIVWGEAVYVLDTGNGRVFKHQLNPTGEALLATADSTVIAEAGQSSDSLPISRLLAMTEIPQGDNHQASNLAILDQGGLLIYQPDRGITTRALAQVASRLAPVAVAGYFGNFYILDPPQNTLLRYRPQLDGYSSQPEPYFLPESDIDLRTAVDIAIDGAVYILFAEGRIEKYWGAEPVAFSLTGLDKPLDDPVAIFTGLDTVLQHIYIADQGNRRIVQLQKDGHFVRQFKPKLAEIATFDHLQDIFVDELGNRLFLLADNQLFVSRLD